LVYSDPEQYALYLDEAITYAKTIHDLYWNSETCLSKLTPDGGTPYIWPFTEQSSMVNGILLAMDKDHPDRAFFEEYLRELLTGLRHYRVRRVAFDKKTESWNDPDNTLTAFGESDGTPHSYAIYAAGRQDNRVDSVIAKPEGIYFDDNIWVAKSFYYAWVNTGDIAYLNEATSIVNWILGEGRETAGALDGIYWNWGRKFKLPADAGDNNRASINTCSTSPTAMVLAKLVTAVSGTPLEGLRDGYLEAAVSLFDFCTDVFVDPSTKCLYDNITLKKGFDAQTDLKKQILRLDKNMYAYNTGTYLTAGAELYALLFADNPEKAEAVLSAALASAKGADNYFADRTVMKGQYSYPSHSWFTSFLVSGFADLAVYDEGCAEYEEHMRSALDFAWKYHRESDGLVSPAWIKGWSHFKGKTGINEDNPRQILYQSANAHSYAMLAQYYR
jgi:hypothetical protein